MGKRSWTDEQMVVAVSGNQSVAGILKCLGLIPTGSNYKTVYDAVKRLNLSTKHWTGQAHLRGKKCTWSRCRSLEEVLVKDSDYRNIKSMKKRLIEEGYIERVCSECGQGAEWNGKPLVLILDHINGVHNDNRLDNLRLLCPNCNSQQDTCAGKNVNM
jgi:hypothetical protein